MNGSISLDDVQCKDFFNHLQDLTVPGLFLKMELLEIYKIKGFCQGKFMPLRDSIRVNKYIPVILLCVIPLCWIEAPRQ
jgi:hypothetical protein